MQFQATLFNLHPHLYANAEWGMHKWEKYRCGCGFKTLQTAFVCAANVRWPVECYPFGIGTSKKNTFEMLGVHLTKRMLNKHFLAFVRVPLSPACLVRIRIQMWTYLYILYPWVAYSLATKHFKQTKQTEWAQKWNTLCKMRTNTSNVFHLMSVNRKCTAYLCTVCTI